MQLPDSWVESLFARFTVRYGAAWLRQWEGVDIAAVKADWAEQLGGVSSGAIKHALENLPIDRPPTVGQFLVLCQRMPTTAPPALPAPQISTSRRAEISQKLRDLRNRLTGAA